MVNVYNMRNFWFCKEHGKCTISGISGSVKNMEDE